MNRIDQAIRDAEGAVDRITSKATIRGWGIINQTQTGHLGDYCDLNHSISYEGGQFRISQRIADTAEGYNSGQERAQLIAAAPDMLNEIDKLREDKQTCVVMLRALYAWLDGIGDGAPDASPIEREALWRCATITETLEKVGELR